LAYYTKNRVGKVQELIATVDAIRTEIVAGLEKFGGYREIRSLLAELETSRQALVLAHDRLCTGQEAFYDSLQAIEQRVTNHSQDSVDRLRGYQELIERLSQTLATDRLQMAEMSVDLSLKYAQIQELSGQIRDMHAQITEKSQLIHHRVANTERGFSELAESVRAEKDQFYELTAETIDRTTDIRARFSNIASEFSLDREAIAALKSELAIVRESVERERERQLDYCDLQFYELLADWSELSGDRQKRSSDRRKILIWLSSLSVAIGLTLAFSIYILMHLKS
jgi:chromosome segregation ATPase